MDYRDRARWALLGMKVVGVGIVLVVVLHFTRLEEAAMWEEIESLLLLGGGGLLLWGAWTVLDQYFQLKEAAGGRSLNWMVRALRIAAYRDLVGDPDKPKEGT